MAEDGHVSLAVLGSLAADLRSRRSSGSSVLFGFSDRGRETVEHSPPMKIVIGRLTPGHEQKLPKMPWVYDMRACAEGTFCAYYGFGAVCKMVGPKRVGNSVRMRMRTSSGVRPVVLQVPYR